MRNQGDTLRVSGKAVVSLNVRDGVHRLVGMGCLLSSSKPILQKTLEQTKSEPYGLLSSLCDLLFKVLLRTGFRKLWRQVRANYRQVDALYLCTDVETYVHTQRSVGHLRDPTLRDHHGSSG